MSEYVRTDINLKRVTVIVEFDNGETVRYETVLTDTNSIDFGVETALPIQPINRTSKFLSAPRPTTITTKATAWTLSLTAAPHHPTESLA